MGFFKLSWLGTIAKVAVQLIAGGGAKVDAAQGLPFTISQILPAVERAIRYQGLGTKEKFDQWLELADRAVGEEPGALHLFGDLPAKLEEELSDHVIEIARIYGYHLLKVDGYWKPPQA